MRLTPLPLHILLNYCLCCSLCVSELCHKVSELLKGRTMQLKLAVNTFRGDYLPPKFCWSLKAGAQFQHSLLQLVPKSGVSSAWTLHSAHPAMVTENVSRVPPSLQGKTPHSKFSLVCEQKGVARETDKELLLSTARRQVVLTTGY